jgi:hypothetical protein
MVPAFRQPIALEMPNATIPTARRNGIQAAWTTLICARNRSTRSTVLSYQHYPCLLGPQTPQVGGFALSAMHTAGGKRMQARYNRCVIGFGRGLALMGLLGLSSCVSTGTSLSGETITVSRRPWFGICAGVCPNYDITVQPDGRVWSVRHHFDAADEVARLRVSGNQLVHFYSFLAPYQPNDGDPIPSKCEHHVSPQEAQLVLKAIEIEIKWFDASNSAHRIACDTPENAALREAIDGALRSLDLDIAGRPLD